MPTFRFSPGFALGLLVLGLTFSGCASGGTDSSATKSADAKTRTILALAAFDSGGSLVDELMRRNAFPLLETLRARGVPDDAILELDRTFHDFFEQTVTESVVPIYLRTFSEQELDEMIAFLSSPAGRKFSAMTAGYGVTRIATLLENAGAYRAGIEAFLRTPTGQHYTSQSIALGQEIAKELNQRMLVRQTDLDRRLQVIRERYKL